MVIMAAKCPRENISTSEDTAGGRAVQIELFNLFTSKSEKTDVCTIKLLLHTKMFVFQCVYWVCIPMPLFSMYFKICI